MKQSIAKLKNLKQAKLDRQSFGVGKHRLLAEIGRRQEMRTVQELSTQERVRLLTMRFFRKVAPTSHQFVAASLVVMLMVSTTFMAHAAVPGDVLWPVKLTIEKAEVALAVDPESESRVHLRHVDNRLRELSVIVLKVNNDKKNQNITQLIRRLEKDITAASQSLKITTTEKKDTKPEAILTLARDLGNKANEAVQVLEQNKIALATTSGQSSDEGNSSDSSATSTEEMGGETSTSTEESMDSSSTELAQASEEVAKVIAEAQQVHRDVSYAALGAMIQLVEKNQGTNRGEVKLIINGKVGELREEMEEPLDKVERIDNNFILHRRESRQLLQKASDALQEALDLVVLDNLSVSYFKLMNARDWIGQAKRFIKEVEDAGSIIPVPVEEVIPVEPIEVKPDPEVTIQTVSSSSTTNSTVPVE